MGLHVSKANYVCRCCAGTSTDSLSFCESLRLLPYVECAGVGAGFYVDATIEKWATNYRMYSYVTAELPALLRSEFGSSLDMDRVSISGHSMGGLGALTCALRNPAMYRSVSAFAPIAHPSEVTQRLPQLTNLSLTYAHALTDTHHRRCVWYLSTETHPHTELHTTAIN